MTLQEQKLFDRVLRESAAVETLASSHNWNMPTKCPACGSDLDINENHTQLFCTNMYCSSRSIGTLAKWVSTIGAKEFGPAALSALQDLGVTSISDLYDPYLYDKLAKVPGFGQNSAQKMYKEITSHCELTIDEFLAGFNIRDCGQRVIKGIMDANPRAFEDFPNNLSNRKNYDSTDSITLNKFIDGVLRNMDAIEDTLYYIKLKEPKKVSTNGKLGGQSFCFTGAASIPRKQLWAMVTDNGGEVHESVKSNTNYLVVADPTSNSTKVQAARKKGVQVISEDEFFNMCK